MASYSECARPTVTAPKAEVLQPVTTLIHAAPFSSKPSQSNENVQSIQHWRTVWGTKPRTFFDLPVELRLKIWHAAAFPRLVRFSRNYHGNVKCGRRRPVELLGACSESREEIRPLYREMFHYKNTTGGSDPHTTQGVLFNPNIDILALDLPTARNLLDSNADEDDLQKLRYIAITFEESLLNHNDNAAFAINVYFLLKQCPNLERLYISVDGTNQRQFWTLGKKESKMKDLWRLHARTQIVLRFIEEKVEPDGKPEEIVRRWRDISQIATFQLASSSDHIEAIHSSAFLPQQIDPPYCFDPFPF